MSGNFIIAMTVSCALHAAPLNASPWSGQKLDKIEYAEKPLALSQIINAEFKESHFTLSSWFQMSFDNSSFIDSRLNGVQALKTRFTHVRFMNTNMAGAKCTLCLFENVTFANVRLDGSRFLTSTFRNTSFVNSDLSRVDFINSTFENCTLDQNTANTAHPELLKKWKLQVKAEQ
nr:hypothetical protein BdHM001_25190 [Bdellovibrio sp. HM001]